MPLQGIYSSTGVVAVNTATEMPFTPGGTELLYLTVFVSATFTFNLKTVVTGVPAAGQARIIANATEYYGNMDFELGDALANGDAVFATYESRESRLK